MNVKNGWLILSMMVPLFGVVGMGHAQRHAGAYILTVTTDEYASDVTYVDTGTVFACGFGTSAAYTNGAVSCTADAYTQVEGDSTSLMTEAWAEVTYTWEWEGPVGTQPFGGSLHWENDGDGAVSVYGWNSDNGGSATAFGVGYSQTWAEPPVSSKVSMGGTASGSVTDQERSSGDVYGYGSPYAPRTYITEDPNNGTFYYSVSWNDLQTGIDTIAPGTTHFCLRRLRLCKPLTDIRERERGKPVRYFIRCECADLRLIHVELMRELACVVCFVPVSWGRVWTRRVGGVYGRPCGSAMSGAPCWALPASGSMTVASCSALGQGIVCRRRGRSRT